MPEAFNPCENVQLVMPMTAEEKIERALCELADWAWAQRQPPPDADRLLAPPLDARERRKPDDRSAPV